jgi:hypothetical protein
VKIEDERGFIAIQQGRPAAPAPSANVKRAGAKHRERDVLAISAAVQGSAFEERVCALKDADPIDNFIAALDAPRSIAVAEFVHIARRNDEVFLLLSQYREMSGDLIGLNVGQVAVQVDEDVAHEMLNAAGGVLDLDSRVDEGVEIHVFRGTPSDFRVGMEPETIKSRSIRSIPRFMR